MSTHNSGPHVDCMVTCLLLIQLVANWGTILASQAILPPTMTTQCSRVETAMGLALIVLRWGDTLGMQCAMSSPGQISCIWMFFIFFRWNQDFSNWLGKTSESIVLMSFMQAYKFALLKQLRGEKKWKKKNKICYFLTWYTD